MVVQESHLFSHGKPDNRLQKQKGRCAKGARLILHNEIALLKDVRSLALNAMPDAIIIFLIGKSQYLE